MPQNAATARRVRRRWPLVSGAVAVGLGLALGALILVRGNTPLGLDAEWMEEVVEHRHPAWEVPSRVFDWVGGGLVATLIALALTIVLLVLRRRWSALYVAVASLASLAVVQLLKVGLGRARPEDALLQLESGSFPSGHTANAATLAVVVALLAWRWWVWAAGAAYVVLMALSRTYLGAHWVTDTVGGLLVGAGVAVVVWAPFALRILAERPLAKADAPH